MRMEVTLGSESDVAAFDFVRRSDVEHLQWLPAVEPLGELLRGNLWQCGIWHGVSVVPPVEKRNGPRCRGPRASAG